MEFKEAITIKGKVDKSENRTEIRKRKREYYKRCMEKIMGFKCQYVVPTISVKSYCIEF